MIQLQDINAASKKQTKGREDSEVESSEEVSPPDRMEEFDSLVDYEAVSEDVPLLAGRRRLCGKQNGALSRFCASFTNALFGVRATYKERSIHFDGSTNPVYLVNNALINSKYNIFTFLPLVLFHQFSYFYNFFYLMVALAQFFPTLKVGPLFTYIAPLAFVLSVTIAKEAHDDLKRYLRDKEINNQLYRRLTSTGFVSIRARDIKVGHFIQVKANQRVPADLVFVKTTAKNGSTFIRTDQLDGETDWKLRRPISVTQSLETVEEIFSLGATCKVEAPRKDIYQFVGNLRFHQTRGLNSSLKEAQSPGTRNSSAQNVGGEVRIPTDVNNQKMYFESLTLENTLWANSVVASGVVLGLVVYTGKETRTTMNASTAREKIGLFDIEVNFLTKVLFVSMTLVSFILMAFRGMNGSWWIFLLRFILLLSSIIPISLRINMDMAKMLYSLEILKDENMPNAVVRSSNLPEEMGRIDYLLTDKTGTLTQNEMTWKKLHIGRASFGIEDMERLRYFVMSHYDGDQAKSSKNAYNAQRLAEKEKMLQSFKRSAKMPSSRGLGESEVAHLANHSFRAIALCHNVTPVIDSEGVTFQAASPDEMALVKFVDEIGLKLIQRDENYVTLQASNTVILKYQVLQTFTFSSERKRMGVVLRDISNDKIIYYLKGAESRMIPLIEPKGSSWLQEECDNFARQGLRTLVYAYKELSEDQWKSFYVKYEEAHAALWERTNRCEKEISKLEQDMKLLALSGVEDKLQVDVPATLESLHNAGIKIWMLTGDKAETAACVAVSAGLKARQHSLQFLSGKEVSNANEGREALMKFAMGPTETVLVIDGDVLEIFLNEVLETFIKISTQAPAVICCRCSPTQKAQIVKLIQRHTKRRACAIGDGGNDVSMIQSANLGVGIVGKEGKQASLAADFSLEQFSHLKRLLLWHGRNSYQRSAKLVQFVIHRGLIIATIQVIFSAMFFFVPVAIFQGWLMVGYTTYYTMAPVFSLVLDVELPESIVFTFPELYSVLKRGRIMSLKTFFECVWKSVYQGTVLLMLSTILFSDSFMNIIAISFTSLILAELLNVASEINRWHPLMIASEVSSVIIYVYSMFILRSYFDFTFILTSGFWWRVLVLTLASWLPVHLFSVVRKIIRPPQYTKLSGS